LQGQVPEQEKVQEGQERELEQEKLQGQLPEQEGQEQELEKTLPCTTNYFLLLMIF
jgi:hypothetical protein